jgi:hypothetical protein
VPCQEMVGSRGLWWRGMNEDFTVMHDPDFPAKRVREKLEHTPEHEVSPELVLTIRS